MLVTVLSRSENRRPPVLLKGYAILDALFAKAFHLGPPIFQYAGPCDQLTKIGYSNIIFQFLAIEIRGREFAGSVIGN
jgi:hypothetical protein